MAEMSAASAIVPSTSSLVVPATRLPFSGNGTPDSWKLSTSPVRAVPENAASWYLPLNA